MMAAALRLARWRELHTDYVGHIWRVRLALQGWTNENRLADWEKRRRA